MTPNPAVGRRRARDEAEIQTSSVPQGARRVIVSGCAAEMELLRKVAGRFNCEIASIPDTVPTAAAIVGDDDEHTLDKRRTLSQSCPVILLTARVSLDFRLAASEAGVSALIQRPVNPIELSEWLSHYVDRDPGKPFSVLIVDDDIVSTRVIAAFLRRYSTCHTKISGV